MLGRGNVQRAPANDSKFPCAGHSDELRTFTGNDAEECQQEGDHDDRKIIGF